MDKNRVKGAAKQVSGTVKESLGKISGDPSLELEGKIEKTEGTIKKTVGQVKDAVKGD
jgi:uncharacterized protein YjbJ (UPF0337 family)